MQIFCDGGSAKSNAIYGKDRALISWGVKIIGDGHDVELMGSRIVGIEQSASHELIAFIEAVIWAHSHNGNTLNTRFFTDYISLTELRRPVLQENRFHLPKHLKCALKKVAQLYSKPTLKLIEQYLIFAEINWVKGHGDCTYHNRADYLSTVAREIAAGTSRAPLSFDDWVKKGRGRWVDGKKIVGRLPFCSVQPAAVEV